MTEKLLLRHAISSPDARRIRLPQGQMTGRILIKECIVEQDTARRDGRRVRHESHLAKEGCPLIRLQELAQMLLPALRVVVRHLPRTECQRKTSDQIPVIVQGFRRDNNTIHTVSLRQGIDFLRGNIRDEHRPRCRPFRTAHPDMPLGQFHMEIRAKTVPIVKFQKIMCIQKICRLLQSRYVLLPCCNGIRLLRHAHGTQNLRPETRYRRLFCLVRKHLARPRRRRDRHNAPRILIAHQPRTIALQSLSCCLPSLRQTLRVDIGEEIRIFRRDGDKRRSLRRTFIVECLSPRRELTESCRRRLTKADV